MEFSSPVGATAISSIHFEGLFTGGRYERRKYPQIRRRQNQPFQAARKRNYLQVWRLWDNFVGLVAIALRINVPIRSAE